MADKPFLKNPYVIGVPLTGDIGFYGRGAIFTFVKDTLNTEQQNVIVLYGQRRVGKTSLLHQLVKHFKGEVLPVYFDLQGRAQNSLGKVLYDLARTVGRPLRMSVPEQARFDNAGRFFREEFLPSVYGLLGQRRLLLLFDEFDILGDELASPEAASETLFPYLQSLIMNEDEIVFIFVVGRRIEELATHFQAIFKQAVYRQVGLLQPEDARALIVEPVKEVLAFEESAVEAILSLTAGHPYFTQLICFELFNALKANSQHLVTAADILKLVSQAIESGHGALTWFWDGLPRAERFIMSAVAHVTDGATGLASKEAIRQVLEKHRIILTGLELTHAPDRLVEWEMLRHEGSANYRFMVELVRRWIIKMHPLESARRDVDFISQRAVRSYENAREAHSAGDLEYARDEYRRALAANPNHSGAQLGLAQVLLELDQIEAAIEEFTKAYALDEISGRDGLVQARLAKGKMLEEAGQPNEAILQYEQALKIAPTHETTRQRLAAIWLGRGHAALATGDLTAGVEPYQKALSFDGSDTLVQEIKSRFETCVRQAEAKQDYAMAAQAIQELQGLLPGNEVKLDEQLASLWLRQGHQALGMGVLEAAFESYQIALDLNSSEKIAQEIKSRLEQKAQQAEAGQNYRLAGKLIQQLRNLLPDDKAVLNSGIAFWTRRGQALEKGGEVREAIKAYQRALVLNPANAVLAKKLEALKATRKQLLKTEELFNQALTAHRAADWPTAAAGWLQLIKIDVLNYKGHNIATLLAQANEAGNQPQYTQPTLVNVKSFRTAIQQLRPPTSRIIPTIGPVSLSILMISIGWAIAMFIWTFVANSGIIMDLFPSNSDMAEISLFGVIVGLAGLITGLSLWWLIQSIQWYHVLTIPLGWSIAAIICLSLTIDLNPGTGPGYTILAISGGAASLVPALVVWWAIPSIGWRQILMITFGWMIGLGIVSGGSGIVIGYWNPSILGAVLGAVSGAILGAVLGAIGGGIMFWQINQVHCNKHLGSEKSSSIAIQ